MESKLSSASGMTPQIILSAILTLIGSSIPQGYGMGVLNCPQAVIRRWIQKAMKKNYDIKMTNHQNVMMWSLVVSIFLVGSTFGALKVGWLVNKIGRRRSFMLSYLLCLISCGIFLLCKIFQFVEIIIASQLLYGISAGISSCIVPVYLSEIEPESFRGLSVIHAFGMSLGMFMSQISGMEMVLGSVNLWPFLLIIPGSGALIALLLYPYLQESPVYNLEKTPLLSTELSSYENELEKYTLSKLYKEKSLHKPILLSVLIILSTVFSGVNAIVAFGNVLFTSAGLNQLQSEIASICATGLRCITQIFSIVITKRSRRRPLLLTSLCGCIVNLLLLMSFLIYHNSVTAVMAIVSCTLYFVFYAIGISSLGCPIITELIPENPRPFVMSYTAGLYWISGSLVGTVFPLVQDTIGEFSLLFFIFSCTASAIIFYFYLPETFNKDSVRRNSNDLHKEFAKSSFKRIS